MQRPYEVIANQIIKLTPEKGLESILDDPEFHVLTDHLRRIPAFAANLAKDAEPVFGVTGVAPLRQLKTVYAMPCGKVMTLLAQLATELEPSRSAAWKKLAENTRRGKDAHLTPREWLLSGSRAAQFGPYFNRLIEEDPHAVFPTSSYRSSRGTVTYRGKGEYIQATMSTSTMTEIMIAEGVLNPDHDTLREIYEPFGRCVAVVDLNVEEHFGEQLEAYFAVHGIELVKLVYRAMEVDKNIGMVENLMSDFKDAGVSRQIPVLVVGGGVLADTAGLACALYHRNTPYVMLATSIVTGIDAGPSPRTCCDGHGYKNLFGAYHAPILTITDRTFFRTLHKGWIRHGVAEIIKMAVVKDRELFEMLEETGIDLVESHFGILTDSEALSERSNEVLAAAMRSYVEAEYDNLYETHQCRPHAYGHTWSPGFEIPSGMLHGHAVGCGMGFGAHLSFLNNWITLEERDRILQLISDFELSLWHPIMEKSELLYQAQEKIIQKRGGALVAPLPKGSIGECGYLDALSREQLEAAVESYREACRAYPRSGVGVEPHCHDVGLENPGLIYTELATVKA